MSSIYQGSIINESSLIRICTRACHHLVGTLQGIILEIGHDTDVPTRDTGECRSVKSPLLSAMENRLMPERTLEPQTEGAGAIFKSEVMSGH